MHVPQALITLPDTVPPPKNATPAVAQESDNELHHHNAIDFQKLKIMYTNVCGFKGKCSSIIEQLSSEKPHFYLLTETMLTTDTDIQIQGYTFFGKARNGKGCGVLLP